MRPGRPFRAGTIFIPLRYHRKKDGTIFPVEIVGGPYVWKGQNVMFGLAHDISDRKAAEANLSNIMREQQIILDNADVGISMIIDRKQVWVNRKATDLFQYSIEEMEGQTTRMLYPSQKAYEQVGMDAYPVLAKGDTYETEQKLIRRDGTSILVRYIGKAVDPPDMSKGTIWLLEDVTERRKAREAFRESHRLLDSIIEFLPDATFVIDDNGKVIAWNKEIEEMTGISKGEMLRREITSTLFPSMETEDRF